MKDFTLSSSLDRRANEEECFRLPGVLALFSSVKTDSTEKKNPKDEAGQLSI